MTIHKTIIYRSLATIVGAIFLITACEVYPETEVSEKYNLYQGLEKVEGAENTQVTITQGADSYFNFEIENIHSDIISSGAHEGWCIEWNKYIAQHGDTHQDLQIYSTQGKEKYKPLNYFLNIKDELKSKDPTLTYKEFQAVIWTIIDGPEFDLNKMDDEDLPARLKKDGKADFNKEKVITIANEVRANSSSFTYGEDNIYALFLKTDEDNQDIMVPSDPQPDSISHGYVEGITPDDDPNGGERTYPVVQADWDGPGGDKRWLGKNLGAVEQPSSIDDFRPETNGWYFQFDALQGHYFEENQTKPWDEFISDSPVWRTENDPCRQLFGGTWRVPTREEWIAFNESAPLVTRTVEAPGPQPGTIDIEVRDPEYPFDVLSMHWAGSVDEGRLGYFEAGSYRTADAHSNEDYSWLLSFSENSFDVDNFNRKSAGDPLRCIEG